MSLSPSFGFYPNTLSHFGVHCAWQPLCFSRPPCILPVADLAFILIDSSRSFSGSLAAQEARGLGVITPGRRLPSLSANPKICFSGLSSPRLHLISRFIRWWVLDRGVIFCLLPQWHVFLAIRGMFCWHLQQNAKPLRRKHEKSRGRGTLSILNSPPLLVHFYNFAAVIVSCCYW